MTTNQAELLMTAFVFECKASTDTLITLKLNPGETVAIITAIQLALTNPECQGSVATIAKAAVDHLIAELSRAGLHHCAKVAAISENQFPTTRP